MNSLDVTKAMEPKADQLNGDDFLTGSRTVKIRDVTVDNTREQKVWVFVEGEPKKPWKPSKTYLRVLTLIWETADASQWIGRELTLYRDPEILWGGAKVGGIAVSHMDGLDRPKTVSVAKTRNTKQSITIQPLVTKDAPKIDVEAVNAAARAEASKGKAAFIKWYQSNAKTRDALTKPIMAELKETADKFDAKQASAEYDDEPEPPEDADPYDDETSESEGDDNGPAI
jgi:hypothetical protein